MTEDSLKSRFTVKSETEWETTHGDATIHHGKVVLADDETGLTDAFRCEGTPDDGYSVSRDGSTDDWPDEPEADEWFTLEGLVKKTWDSDHDSIAQTGIAVFGGTEVRFTVWTKASDETVEENDIYRFESVATSEYEGDIQLSVNKNSTTTPIDECDTEVEAKFDEAGREWMEKFGPVASDE